MRDVDADFATVLLRRGEASRDGWRRTGGAAAGAGKPRLRPRGDPAFAPPAAEGGTPGRELLRFDTDLGKHGDTGDSELTSCARSSHGDADAGALGDADLGRVARRGSSRGRRPGACLAQPVLPLQLHGARRPGCERRERGAQALLAMRHDDPTLRPAMELEGVRRWLPGDRSGYAALTGAMREQGPVVTAG